MKSYYKPNNLLLVYYLAILLLYMSCEKQRADADGRVMTAPEPSQWRLEGDSA